MDAEISDEERLSLKEITEAGKVLIEKGNRVFLDAQIQRDVMSIILFTSGPPGSPRELCFPTATSWRI